MLLFGNCRDVALYTIRYLCVNYRGRIWVEILFIDSDLIAKHLGKNTISELTDIEQAVIAQKIAAVEAAISRYYVDLSSAATRVEFLPVSDYDVVGGNDLSSIDLINGKVVDSYTSMGSDVLQLTYTPVNLSGLIVNEHVGAYGGQASGAFAIGTQLVSGVDYYLDVDTTGVSKSGIIRRISGAWSQQARSIKITYVSGSLSISTEDAALVREVIIMCVLNAYRFWKKTMNVNPAGVAASSESIGKYSYSTGGTSGSSGNEFGGMNALIPDEFGGMISHLFNWGKVL